MSMDERDVTVNKLREQLAFKEEENKALQIRLEIVRSELDKAEKSLQEVKVSAELAASAYDEIRDKYTKLMSGIMEMIAKLQG